MNIFNSNIFNKKIISLETKDYIKQLDLIEYTYLNPNNLIDKECSICLENFDLSILDNTKNIIQNEKKSNIFALFYNLYNLFNERYIETSENKTKNNSNSICILSCGHIFHYNCVYEWIEKDKTCPLCRQELKIIK